MYAANGLQLANGADRGKVTITATYLEILGFGYNSVSLTADLAVAGANGLDTGTEAANTWYAVHVINSSVGGPIASLLSTSASAPTLPSGYSNSRRIGWVRNNGTSDLYRFVNAAGDDWFLWNEDVSAGDFLVLNVTTSATTYTDVSCAAVSPSTCRRVRLMVRLDDVSSTLFAYLRDKNQSNIVAAASTGFGTGAVTLFGSMMDLGVDSSQVLQYRTQTSTIDMKVSIWGYEDKR